MKITIIGAGNMGSAFAHQLVKARHAVSITSRDVAKAQTVAQASGATAVPLANASVHADVIVLATAQSDAAAALAAAGSAAGKVVVDISNPLTADYMALTIGHTTSAAEELAEAFPDAVVIKGFNTLFAQVLAAGADFAGNSKVTVFLAGDSEGGKQTVRALAESMGFDVIDAGGLRNARYLEPLGGLNVYLGYGAGMGTGIAPTWLQKA